jgi:acyl-CoA synthetase (AMP-forming)/AMP-acid ligase II
VVAVVEPRSGASVDDADLVRFVKARLSSYKAPRHVVVAPIGRGPNAKPDLRALQSLASARVAEAMGSKST